jgi:hypothetical protein
LFLSSDACCVVGRRAQVPWSTRDTVLFNKGCYHDEIISTHQQCSSYGLSTTGFGRCDDGAFKFQHVFNLNQW